MPLTTPSEDLMDFPDWQSLPSDLSAAIAKRLDLIFDYTSFRGVCNSWRSAATPENFDRSIPRVPWLMYEAKEVQNEEDDIKVNFFDLVSSKSFRAYRFFSDYDVCTSSCGWLLGVGKYSGRLHLIHSISAVTIELPDVHSSLRFKHVLSTFGTQSFIKKMVLSGSPLVEAHDLVVVICCVALKNLGFWRQGDRVWTMLDSSNHEFSDIIYTNGKLYAVDIKHSPNVVVEYDICGHNPIRIKRSFDLPIGVDVIFGNMIFCCYLAESLGKLVIVFKLYGVGDDLPFRVFELGLRDGNVEEITDLGNRTLFLGKQSSMCVDVSALGDVRPNCIYNSRIIYNMYDMQMDKYFVDNNNYCLDWVVPSF